MKQLLTLIALALSFTARSQWSMDPAAPLVLCNAANAQSSVRAFPDGSGGWYAFWLDKRVDGTNAAVFGQHVDGDGYPQWTTNGKAIVQPAGETVLEFAAAPLDNGEVLVTYIHHPTIFQDTLTAIAIDTNGDPTWAQPVRITQAGSPILGLDNLKAISSPGGAMIGWYDNYFGGSNGVNLTRIGNNGQLPWGPDGYAIPNAAYGPFDLYNDGASGTIVQWRTGNGSGAQLYAMRVDSAGVNDWAANVNTSAGGTGLNYAFSSVSGTQHQLITAWRNMPGHLDMARLDTNGLLPWGNVPTVLCDYASSQDGPALCALGGEYVAAWADNRPPASNADLFVQRFDGNGNLLWNSDGLPGIQVPTYIPTPGIVAANNGSVIVTIDASNPGFCAQRILSNGSPAWPAPTAFCISAFNPFYGDQVKLTDGTGGVVAFWTDQNTVYAGRIYENGELGDHTGLSELFNAEHIQPFPSPTEGPLNVLLPANARVRSLRTFDLHGRNISLPLTGSMTDHLQLDASSLAPGLYTLEVRTDAGVRTGRFVVAR